MRPRALWRASLLAVLIPMLPLDAAPPKASYADKIAEVIRLPAESSWALARDAYAEARTLTPDAVTNRWCELWIADVSWRAENRPADAVGAIA